VHRGSCERKPHLLLPVDLKPENILFNSYREDSLLCIADFGTKSPFSTDTSKGFAKELSEGNEMVSTPCGTIPYLAPEVANSGIKILP
jgi:serine/threonine protein kinase